MKYYTAEIQIDQGVKNTAGIKARDDIEKILQAEGYKAIYIERPVVERKKANRIKKLIAHKSVKDEWDRKLSGLKRGDQLLIQFPVIHHSLLLYRTIRRLTQKGIKVLLLVHDLETFRVALRQDNSLKKKIRLQLEECSLLNMSSRIIVHNTKMKDALVSMGIKKTKLVSLEIFDYLIPEFDKKFEPDAYSLDKPVVIAGALRPHKARYVYNLPSAPDFNLYGVGYEGKDKENVHYLGAFPPDDLPFQIRGSFGLVWDGESSQTCTGVYGGYLKINNPHKTSLYLAAGIPVIIWSQAALADFVKENGCGFTVDSLEQIGDILAGMDENEYCVMKKQAQMVGAKMRAGYYTRQVVG